MKYIAVEKEDGNGDIHIRYYAIPDDLTETEESRKTPELTSKGQIIVRQEDRRERGMSICINCGSTYEPTTADITGMCWACRNKLKLPMTYPNTCVCCGAIIPEGRQVCRKCEDQNIQLPQPSNSLMREMYRRLAAGKCMNNSVEWELCTMTDEEILAVIWCDKAKGHTGIPDGEWDRQDRKTIKGA